MSTTGSTLLHGGQDVSLDAIAAPAEAYVRRHAPGPVDDLLVMLGLVAPPSVDERPPGMCHRCHEVEFSDWRDPLCKPCKIKDKAARRRAVCAHEGCMARPTRQRWCGTHVPVTPVWTPYRYSNPPLTRAKAAPEKPKPVKDASTCAAEGCVRDAARSGLCHSHFQVQRIHGTTNPVNSKSGRAPCVVEGCDSLSHAKGMCPAHYNRTKRAEEKATERKCEIEDCDRKHFGRGLCKKHYNQHKRGNLGSTTPRATPTKGGRATCSIDGCACLAHAHRLCSSHAHEWRKANPRPCIECGAPSAESRCGACAYKRKQERNAIK